MADIMLALGEYRFSIDHAAYQSLRRTARWKWAAQDRIGHAPSLHYTGNGAEEIELSGTIYPHFRGGTGQIENMRAMAGEGQPLVMSGGSGRHHGNWVIEEIEEDEAAFLKGGTAAKVGFRLRLKRYVGQAHSTGKPASSAGVGQLSRMAPLSPPIADLPERLRPVANDLPLGTDVVALEQSLYRVRHIRGGDEMAAINWVRGQANTLGLGGFNAMLGNLANDTPLSVAQDMGIAEWTGAIRALSSFTDRPGTAAGRLLAKLPAVSRVMGLRAAATNTRTRLQYVRRHWNDRDWLSRPGWPYGKDDHDLMGLLLARMMMGGAS